MDYNSQSSEKFAKYLHRRNVILMKNTYMQWFDNKFHFGKVDIGILFKKFLWVNMCAGVIGCWVHLKNLWD